MKRKYPAKKRKKKIERSLRSCELPSPAIVLIGCPGVVALYRISNRVMSLTFDEQSMFGNGVYAEKTIQEIGSSRAVTRELLLQIEIALLKKAGCFVEPIKHVF